MSDRRRSPLRRVAHPRWRPSEDVTILLDRKRGRSLDRIAKQIGRPTIGVTARWHKLRSIGGLVEVLEQHIETYGDSYEALL